MQKFKYELFGIKPEMIDTQKTWDKNGKCISEKLKLKYVINKCDLDEFYLLLHPLTQKVELNNKIFKIEKYEYMCFINIFLTEIEEEIL